MRKITPYIIIFLIINFILSFPAKGAEVGFNENSQEILVNQEFKVSIVINTNEEDINAIEGEITLPKDILSLNTINDANSIISLWVVEPQLINDTIKFSGIVPGGYKGNKGLLFDLIFKAKKEGEGFINFQKVRILRNDGLGTEVPVDISDFKIIVKGKMPPNQVTPVEIIDNNPPEPFMPIISKDPTIFDGKYFLVFSTKDKESGIDYYEVKEGKGPFVRAKSPYLIKNQKLDKEIIVKAIDRKGNERIAVVKPLNKPAPWYTRYKTFTIIVVIVLLISVISYFFWKNYVQKKKKD